MSPSMVEQNNLTAHWGIQFFDSSNNAIVNYPEYHKKRGEAKNQETWERKGTSLPPDEVVVHE